MKKLDTNRLKKDKNLRFVLQIIMVALAGVIGGFSFCSFFEPAGIIPTGLSGLAQIIHNLFEQGDIIVATSIIYLIINVFLFVFSLRIFVSNFIFL